MIKLGEEVRDKITGCKGIAVGRSEWINGCNRIGLQRKVKKDGEVPDVAWVDEPQLEVVGKKKAAKGSKSTGGPLMGIPVKSANPLK